MGFRLKINKSGKKARKLGKELDTQSEHRHSTPDPGRRLKVVHQDQIALLVLCGQRRAQAQALVRE